MDKIKLSKDTLINGKVIKEGTKIEILKEGNETPVDFARKFVKEKKWEQGLAVGEMLFQPVSGVLRDGMKDKKDLTNSIKWLKSIIEAIKNEIDYLKRNAPE